MSQSFRHSRVPVLSLIAAAACWGVATVISKRAVDEIDPLTLLPIELTVSVAALTIATTITKNRLSWNPELRRLALLGALNPGVAYALSLAGLAHVTASVSVLLWAIEPILILAFAYTILRERVPLATAVSASIALAGVALVVYQPGNRASPLGIILTVAGVASCAIYTILSSKLLADTSTLSVVLLQQIAALLVAIALFAGSHIFGNPSALRTVSPTAWWSAGVAGILYYGLAFCFYVTGLKHVTASHAGVFINLVPVFGIAASFIALEERLTTQQWIGATIVIAAVTSVSTRHQQSEITSAQQ